MMKKYGITIMMTLTYVLVKGGDDDDEKTINTLEVVPFIRLPVHGVS